MSTTTTIKTFIVAAVAATFNAVKPLVEEDQRKYVATVGPVAERGVRQMIEDAELARTAWAHGKRRVAVAFVASAIEAYRTLSVEGHLAARDSDTAFGRLVWLSGGGRVGHTYRCAAEAAATVATNVVDHWAQLQTEDLVELLRAQQASRTGVSETPSLRAEDVLVMDWMH